MSSVNVNDRELLDGALRKLWHVTGLKKWTCLFSLGKELATPFHAVQIHNSLRDSHCTHIMRLIVPLLSLSALLAPVQSLYFYIDGTTPKCFFEELPKDTIVVGHYTAEEYDDNRKLWSKHDGLNVFISVDVHLPSPNNAMSPSEGVRKC